jgi:hypothetical protein
MDTSNLKVLNSQNRKIVSIKYGMTLSYTVTNVEIAGRESGYTAAISNEVKLVTQASGILGGRERGFIYGGSLDGRSLRGVRDAHGVRVGVLELLQFFLLDFLERFREVVYLGIVLEGFVLEFG